MVHLVLGIGRARLRPVCESGGKPDPGRQHRGFGFLRGRAGLVSGGIFHPVGRGHGHLLGGAGCPGPGLCPLFFAQNQLSLV